MSRFLLQFVAISAILATSNAAHARSREVAIEFQRLNPCPATGLPYGSCPGYIRDHVWPLCAGGADDPSNMQWQTAEDARAKDQWEFDLCRKLRRPDR